MLDENEISIAVSTFKASSSFDLDKVNFQLGQVFPSLSASLNEKGGVVIRSEKGASLAPTDRLCWGEKLDKIGEFVNDIVRWSADDWAYPEVVGIRYRSQDGDLWERCWYLDYNKPAQRYIKCLPERYAAFLGWEGSISNQSFLVKGDMIIPCKRRGKKVIVFGDNTACNPRNPGDVFDQYEEALAHWVTQARKQNQQMLKGIEDCNEKPVSEREVEEIVRDLRKYKELLACVELVEKILVDRQHGLETPGKAQKW